MRQYQNWSFLPYYYGYARYALHHCPSQRKTHRVHNFMTNSKAMLLVFLPKLYSCYCTYLYQWENIKIYCFLPKCLFHWKNTKIHPFLENREAILLLHYIVFSLNREVQRSIILRQLLWLYSRYFHDFDLNAKVHTFAIFCEIVRLYSCFITLILVSIGKYKNSSFSAKY